MQLHSKNKGCHQIVSDAYSRSAPAEEDVTERSERDTENGTFSSIPYGKVPLTMLWQQGANRWQPS